MIFAHYNIENYLQMNAVKEEKPFWGLNRSTKKIILIRIIKEIHPDILGVADGSDGAEDQFEEFQKR